MIILAVFRSRTHSLDYAERLNRNGVAATVATAPKEARIGCGLSVRFDARNFVRANAILKSRRYSSFSGLYRLDYVNGRTVAVRYTT